MDRVRPLLHLFSHEELLRLAFYLEVDYFESGDPWYRDEAEAIVRIADSRRWSSRQTDENRRW